MAGSYLAQLIVNDGLVDSPADSVLINVEMPNTIPVANAGVDQVVFTGDLVTLDGSGSSDADNDLLSFSWSIISAPNFSTAGLSNTAVESPTLIPDVAGTYIMQLIVNDGLANSSADTVTLTVTDAPTLALNFSMVEWAGGDGKLVITGSGAGNGEQYIVQYSSTGVQLGSFRAKGNKFEAEIQVNSAAPCSIRIVEVSTAAFMDQVVSNAPTDCQ